MKKKEKLLKKILVFCLVISFSYESFAAVVSDNDGAAFITKAEFDSMKQIFQQEIDKFNINIDNKIESAIAGYLSGVKNAKETYLDSMLNKVNALAEDYYLDSSSNKVKYGYRTMARTYNTPTTQKPVGAKTAFFISRGDIAGSDRTGYARFGLTNATRTGMGYVDIPSGTGARKPGIYFSFSETPEGEYYSDSSIDTYTYLFYVGGAARTVTAGNTATNTTNAEYSTFTIENFKNQRTDWSIGSGNATFIWNNQDSNTEYSTIKCAYGTTFEKTSSSTLLPVCGGIDVNVTGLSSKQKTRMTLQESEYVWDLFYTQTFWVNDGTNITNRKWLAGNSGTFNPKFTFCFNCHPYQTINLKNLVDYYSTSVLGEAVKITDGIPVCKATTDGRIDMKVKYMSRNTSHNFSFGMWKRRFYNQTSGDYGFLMLGILMIHLIQQIKFPLIPNMSIV